MARLIFGPAMNIQAPPNLSPGALAALIEAGINDWGGVSPVTPDHVNPEAPWPHLRRPGAGDRRERASCWSSGSRSIRATRARTGTWLDPGLRSRAARSRSMARAGRATDDWSPGGRWSAAGADVRAPAAARHVAATAILQRSCERASAGRALMEADIVRAVPGTR